MLLNSHGEPLEYSCLGSSQNPPWSRQQRACQYVSPDARRAAHLTEAPARAPHPDRQKGRDAHFAQSAAGKEQLRRQKYEQWRMAGTPPPMPRLMPMLAACIRARPLTAAPYHPAARTACRAYRRSQLTVQLITPCSTKEKRLNSPPKGFSASITLYLEFPGQ